MRSKTLKMEKEEKEDRSEGIQRWKETKEPPTTICRNSTISVAGVLVKP